MRTASAVLAAALALGLAGCTNQTVKKVRALADRACKCVDAACAEGIEKEYLAMVKEGPKGSDDDRDEVESAYNRMRDCIATARSGPASSPPAAPAPAPAEEGK